MVVAECPKMFDVQCIWGWIFVSLENDFCFLVFAEYISFSFLREIYMEKVLQELFLQFLFY